MVTFRRHSLLLGTAMAVVLAYGQTALAADTGYTLTNASQPTSAGTISFQSGGVLKFSRTGVSVSNAVSLAGADTVDTQGFSDTLAGIISGGGGLTVQTGTAGLLTLTKANTYTGGTTISTGSNLQIGTGGSLVGSILDNGNLTVNSSSGTTLSGAITGSGSLTQSGSGILKLAGADAVATAVNAGRTLQVVKGGSIAGDVTNAGTLSFVLGAGVQSTLSGNVSGAGAMQVSSGAVSLTGTNYAYGNGVTVASGAALEVSKGGTLTLNGGASNLGTGVTIDSGASLQVNGGSLAGTVSDNGAVTVNNKTAMSLSGVNGSGALIQSGAGTLTLTGADSVTTTTIASGSTLQVGTGGSIAGAVSDNGILKINSASAAGVTLGGNITGTGTLVQSGSGVLTLTAANNVATTINSGTKLQTSGAGSIGADVVDQGTLIFGGAGQTYGNVISGGGSVQVNAGTVTLTKANTYTSGTTIGSGGTLNLGAGGSIGGNVTSSGAVEILGNGAVNGSGTYLQSGGTTTVDASGLLSEKQITVNGGSLRSSGTLSGSVTVGSNGSLELVKGPQGALASLTNQGKTTVDSGASLTGGGNIATSGGSFNILGGGSVSGTGYYTQSGGTTTVDATGQLSEKQISVNGGSMIANGSLGGAVSVGTAGTLTLANTQTLSGLSNANVTTIAAGANVANNGNLSNSGNLGIAATSSGNSATTLSNAGTLSNSGGLNVGSGAVLKNTGAIYASGKSSIFIDSLGQVSGSSFSQSAGTATVDGTLKAPTIGVSGGTLTAEAGGVLNGAVSVGSLGNLALKTDQTAISGLNTAGNTQLSGAGVNIAATVYNSGTLGVDSKSTLTGTGFSQSGSSANTSVYGSLKASTIGIGGGTLTAYNGGTLSGAVSVGNAGSLVLNGMQSGISSLSNSGNTQLNGASLSITGAVNNNSGGTLSGGGTINAAVTNSGTIDGSGAKGLTLAGAVTGNGSYKGSVTFDGKLSGFGSITGDATSNLTFGDSNTVVFSLTSSKISAGTVNLGGILDVFASNPDIEVAAGKTVTYNLITANTINGGFSSVSLPTIMSGVTDEKEAKITVSESIVTLSSGQQAVQVQLSAVPIPGALVLFGSGLVGLGLVGRRRAKQAGASA